MKCQSCHFISSNYRLACRPFNDHLQRCLQCIKGSTKSLTLSLSGFHFILKHTHTRLHYHELAQTLIGIQKVCAHTQKYTLPPHTVPLYSLPKLSLLVYLQCAKQDNSLSLLHLACQSKAEQNICNHNSSVPFNYTEPFHLTPAYAFVTISGLMLRNVSL